MTKEELYELRLKGKLTESIALADHSSNKEIAIPLLQEYLLAGNTNKLYSLARKYFLNNEMDYALLLFSLDYDFNKNVESLDIFNDKKPILKDKSDDYIRIPKYKEKKLDKANLLLSKALNENNDKKREKLLIKASKYEHTDAEYNLGIYYDLSNKLLANKYYEKAAKKGHYPSMLKLAEYNKNNTKNPLNELYWVKEMVKLNNPVGLYRYAKCIIDYYDSCLDKYSAKYNSNSYSENLEIVVSALEKIKYINKDAMLMLANIYYDNQKQFKKDLFLIYLYFLPFKENLDILEILGEIEESLIKKIQKNIDEYYIKNEYNRVLTNDEIKAYARLYRNSIKKDSHKLKEDLAATGHISMLKYMLSYYENNDNDKYLYWKIKAIDFGILLSDSSFDSNDSLSLLFKLKLEGSKAAANLLENALTNIDDSKLNQIKAAANNNYIDAVEFLVNYYENKDLSEALIWMIKAYDLKNKHMLLKIAEAYVELLKPIDDVIMKMIVDNPTITNKYIEYFLGFMTSKKEICDKYNINATLRDSLNHYLAASTIQKYRIRKDIYLRIAKCYLEGIGTNINLELAAEYLKPYDKKQAEELIEENKKRREIRANEWQAELLARRSNKINEIVNKFNDEFKKKSSAIEKANASLKPDTYYAQIEKRNKLLLNGYPMDMLYDDNGKFIGSQFIYGAYQMIMDVEDAKNMLRAKRDYQNKANNGNTLEDLKRLKEDKTAKKLDEEIKQNRSKYHEKSNDNISNEKNPAFDNNDDLKIDYFDTITRKDRKINLLLLPMISDDAFPNKFRIINRYTYSSNVGQYVIKKIYVNGHLLNQFDEITDLAFCLNPGIYDFKITFRFYCLPGMNELDDFKNTVYKERKNLDITHTFECKAIKIEDDNKVLKLVISAYFYSLWDKTEYDFKNNRDFYVWDFEGWKYHINDMRLLNENEINSMLKENVNWQIYRTRRFNPKISSFEKILARAEEQIYLVNEEDL